MSSVKPEREYPDADFRSIFSSRPAESSSSTNLGIPCENTLVPVWLMMQPSLHTAGAVMLAHQAIVETQHEAQFCFSPWRERTNSQHRQICQIYLFTEMLRCEPGEKRTRNWSSVYSRARLLGLFDGSSVNLPTSVIAGEAARNLIQYLRENSLPDSHGDNPDPAPRPREPPSWSHRWQGGLFYRRSQESCRYECPEIFPYPPPVLSATSFPEGVNPKYTEAHD